MENNELGAISFVDKRIGVLGTTGAVAGKSGESVTTDVTSRHMPREFGETVARQGVLLTI